MSTILVRVTVPGQGWQYVEAVQVWDPATGRLGFSVGIGKMLQGGDTITFEYPGLLVDA